MSRLRMEWDWVRGVKVMVFSDFITHGKFKVKIMVGENPEGPRGTPKWTGMVCGHATLSRREVFDACVKYVDRKLEEAGIALKEYDTVMRGVKA